MIDKDGDGKITEKELKACFEELGQRVSAEDLKSMVGEVKGPLDFPAFLEMFEKKLNGTDPEEMLLSAFKLFDMAGAGAISREELKEMLTANGRPADRLSEAQVSSSAPSWPTKNLGVSFRH